MTFLTSECTLFGNIHYFCPIQSFHGNSKDMKRLRNIIVAAVLLLSVAGCASRQEGDGARTATIHTNKGDITLMLFDETPAHRDNFIKMCDDGFYDSLLFHRVIEAFVIQAGDPDSRGAAEGERLGEGDAGHKVEPEFVDGLVHIRGAVGAAREGDAVNPGKLSSGSHFYIVQGRNGINDAAIDKSGIDYGDTVRHHYLREGGTPFLDGGYTVFGYVIEGMDVVDDIAASATDSFDRPIEDVVITGTETGRLSREETEKYYKEYHAE